MILQREINFDGGRGVWTKMLHGVNEIWARTLEENSDKDTGIVISWCVRAGNDLRQPFLLSEEEGGAQRGTVTSGNLLTPL